MRIIGIDRLHKKRSEKKYKEKARRNKIKKDRGFDKVLSIEKKNKKIKAGICDKCHKVVYFGNKKCPDCGQRVNFYNL